jgi:hypothetical protein
MKLKFYHLLPICIFATMSLNSQPSEKWVKERMWGSGDPDFEITEVPDKWKDESAVILCKRIEYEYKKPALSSRVNNDYYLRQRIKLLDKSAVDEFSEFAFEKVDQFFFSRDGVFLGIKVVKPDGTEKEIDVDEAVQLQKYKNSRERKTIENAYHKLAIPNLEIGDIIDYYYVSISTISVAGMGSGARYVFDPVYYVLTDYYPILKGKIAFLPERRCFINLSYTNGAPEPVKKSAGDKDYFVIEYNDLEKSKTELWTYPLRQDPTVKFQVIINPPFVSEDEIYFLGEPEVPKTKAREADFVRLLKYLTESPAYASQMKKAGNRFLKKQRLNDEPETLVSDLYSYFRHYLYFQYSVMYGNKYLYRYTNNRYEFIKVFSDILNEHDIDHFVFLGVQQSVGTLEEAVLLSEINPGIRLIIEEEPIYIFDPSGHSVFDEPFYEMENTDIVGTYVGKNIKQVTLQYDKIPLSHHTDNIQVDTIAALVDPAKPDNLLVFHNLSSTGSLKEMFHYMLLYPSDYFFDEYKHMQQIREFSESDLIEMQNEMKPVIENLQNDREEQNKNLEGWLTENHMVSSVKVDSFQLKSLGRFNNDPNLVFEVRFQTSEMVKNAGDYLIVEAGKLIGKNVDLSAREKQRDKDIFMPCPRQYEWYITILIPEGYTIENINNFNYHVENETGGFISRAMVGEKAVTIEATKYYTHNYEPLENWPAMLEFLEAANDFVQQKMVLKK